MRQTKSQDIQKRIKQTVKALSAGIWEKDRLIAMGILCCVSGESLFLLGPPGTGKSLIARRLKEVFGDSRAFEYLMSRFSTPDEIFGPVSIRKLREEDCYERCTDGYLPPRTLYSWTRSGKPVRPFKTPCSRYSMRRYSKTEP